MVSSASHIILLKSKIYHTKTILFFIWLSFSFPFSLIFFWFFLSHACQHTTTPPSPATKNHHNYHYKNRHTAKICQRVVFWGCGGGKSKAIGRHGKMGGFGSGQSSCRSNRSRVKMGHFKQVKNKFGSIKLRVRLTCNFYKNFIILLLIFIFYKENNMYLPFGKLCNKLLDVKCIILNSPLISRMNLVKLINTYTIILKLYKS